MIYDGPSYLLKESCLLVNLLARVDGGSDDLDNLGHLGHFLVGQVGLICKLSYLDVTRRTVLASGKCVNFGSDECTEISLV